MSSKILLKFLGGCLALFIVMGIAAVDSEAQSASGKLETPASQIVSPVLEDDSEVGRHTHVTITNTHPDRENVVTVHVQFLIDEDGCDEIDFVDTFTGQDTHTYVLDENCAVNGGDTGSCFGGLTGINDRDGVWVVTPIVSNDDRTAKAFNHLHGVTQIFTEDKGVDTVYRFNSVGRTAVNESGNALADDTPLDGTANILETIVPNQQTYHYASSIFSDPLFADLITVAISDDHGDIAGYKAKNGTATFDNAHICDDDENCFSCDDITYACIDVNGINNNVNSIDGTRLVVCDESSEANGVDHQLLDTAGANAVFSILGLMTSNLGGASHVFVQ